MSGELLGHVVMIRRDDGATWPLTNGDLTNEATAEQDALWAAREMPYEVLVCEVRAIRSVNG